MHSSGHEILRPSMELQTLACDRSHAGAEADLCDTHKILALSEQKGEKIKTRN
jgi:hypothetical protein